MISKEYIKELVSQQAEYLIEIRRYLHANPELSEHEQKTANYISGLLSTWEIEHQTGVGGYGITGCIKGIKPQKKIIALRADMDALPIIEENEILYKSLKRPYGTANGHLAGSY